MARSGGAAPGQLLREDRVRTVARRQGWALWSHVSSATVLAGPGSAGVGTCARVPAALLGYSLSPIKARSTASAPHPAPIPTSLQPPLPLGRTM